MNIRCLPLLILAPFLHAASLYTTDFENFAVGSNNWSGTDLWQSNDNQSGAQAIERDLFPGIALGNSATLGFAKPQQTLVSIYRFFDYDHAATGLNGVEINSLVALGDSTNGRRDDFYITIYNRDGKYLASIRLDNDPPEAPDSQFGIWREDGLLQFDTLYSFTHGELFDLYINIDLASNTWSADIGGFPLFSDVTFNATGETVSFGYLAFEWTLTAPGTAGYGDNFLVIDELSVRSYPIGVDPFTASASRDPATGRFTLSWLAEFGFDYQVECSSNLIDWFDTLPGSSFSGVTTPNAMSYTDTTTHAGSAVYYRVVRRESP